MRFPVTGSTQYWGINHPSSTRGEGIWLQVRSASYCEIYRISITIHFHAMDRYLGTEHILHQNRHHLTQAKPTLQLCVMSSRTASKPRSPSRRSIPHTPIRTILTLTRELDAYGDPRSAPYAWKRAIDPGCKSLRTLASLPPALFTSRLRFHDFECSSFNVMNVRRDNFIQRLLGSTT